MPAHLVLPERVKRQTYAYDWLGSLTLSEDDRNAFWDRGMGPMRTGAPSGTAVPYRFRDAGDLAQPSRPGQGSASAAYDDTGNITQIVVNRTGAACSNGTTNCSITYVYSYDELGRMYRAQRTEGATAKADLRFTDDHSDNRVIKSDVFPTGTANDRHTLYVFNTLELRRAPHNQTNQTYTRNADTEVPYLVANGVRLGRVVLESAGDGEPRIAANARHVFLNLGDHLGSASIIVDLATGELVERMTYQPYGATESDYRPARWRGFKEDYRFTGKEEDQEVGLTYFGKRFLSAALGRWVSPDPLAVHRPGAADLNLYAYVHGKVLSSIDPLGLCDPRENMCDGGSQGTGGNTDAAPAPARSSGAVERFVGNAVKLVGVLASGVFAGLGTACDSTNCNGNGPPANPELAPVVAAGFQGAAALISRASATTATAVTADGVAAEAEATSAVRTVSEAAPARTLVGTEEGAAAHTRVAELQGTRRAGGPETVYRVQGGIVPNASKARFQLGEGGSVTIVGDDMLFVNLGQEGRALEFLAKRGEAAELVRFDVTSEFAARLRARGHPTASWSTVPGTSPSCRPDESSRPVRDPSEHV